PLAAIAPLTAAGPAPPFNAAADQWFRSPAADAVGSPFTRFASETFAAVLAGYTREKPSEEPKRPLWVPEGLTAVRADGGEFPVEATVSRVLASGAPLYTIILRDVNERRRAEAEYRHLQGLTSSLQDEVQAALGD